MPDSSPQSTALVTLALATCRAQGCTCDVEVEYEADPRHPSLGHLHCHHDDWCPLLLARNRHAS